MKTFNYTAVDKNNTYLKGKVEAKTKRKALLKLEADEFSIVNLQQEKKLGFSRLNRIGTITRLDKIFFTRHLHTLLESGIGLDQATKIAAEQTNNVKFREILENVYNSVRRGQTLSTALSTHRKYFSNFFVNLIRVGEKSGTLEDSLAHLLEQQEKDYELITKTRGAMIYPIIIIIATIFIVALMMTFVVPTIAGVLLEYDVELPLSTKILIATSNFLINYGIILLSVSILLLAFLIRLVRKTKKGKWYWESILLNLPLIKRIVVEFNVARFCRSMDALLRSGVAIDEALELATNVCHNSHYQKTIHSSITFVRKGVPLTESFHAHPKLYPSIATRMLEIGQKTGKLDYMFNRLAIFYEKSVINTMTNLSVIIEPILLLTIGLVVGFVAVSILTPIWKFAQTI